LTNVNLKFDQFKLQIRLYEIFVSLFNNEIIQEALRLPATARFEIVDQLMQSLDKPDPEIERMWGEEAVRRLAALDAGRGQTYAADEVFGQE
jgi:putative addiction module component (TIGR02574 family)